MSAPSETPLSPGARLAHYEVRREIGGGAMGTVYEAWDSSLDRTVAVKVLRDRIAHEPAIVERFFREARAAARVNHPNLTHIYFVGREGARPFFAMEHVPGETLEQIVAARGPLPLGDAVDVLVQAARGLAAAHAAAVVHRDVKPSNLIRRADGVLKVADFGLAKSMSADVNATGGGSLMGTPTFMSPEQCRGRDVDARCDVYALGLVAWFVLVGRPPFASTSLGELLNEQINAPLPSAAKARADLPPAVDDVLGRMCAKDPEARPATMEEVVGLLESLRPRRIVRAPFFARGTAAVVDGTAALVAGALAAFVIAGVGSLIDRLGLGLPGWVERVAGQAIVALVSSAAALAVLVLPEIWYQTSIGKYLFDLRVVRADGTRPGFVAIASRVALRYPMYLVLALTLVGPIQNQVALAAVALQVVAVVTGVVLYAARHGLTLSDVVTRTRVAYRSPDER